MLETHAESVVGVPRNIAPAKLRVLVVEDNPDCAESMAMLLRLFGHEVELARDGSTALSALQVSPPHVVLLDIGLPGGMDGWQLAERIKNLPGPKKPMLVALSGYGRDDDKRQSAACGIDVHLTKPVDPHTLQALLRRVHEFLTLSH